MCVRGKVRITFSGGSYLPARLSLGPPFCLVHLRPYNYWGAYFPSITFCQLVMPMVCWWLSVLGAWFNSGACLVRPGWTIVLVSRCTGPMSSFCWSCQGPVLEMLGGAFLMALYVACLVGSLVGVFDLGWVPGLGALRCVRSGLRN